MMPHPERTENGDQIFSSMKEFIQMGNPITDHDLAHNQESYRLKSYSADESCTEWLVNMIITDNEAVSVQNALIQLGYDIVLTRQTHWEIETAGEKENILEKSKHLVSYIIQIRSSLVSVKQVMEPYLFLYIKRRYAW